MCHRPPRYAPVLLLLATLITIGCDSRAAAPTVPAATSTAPQSPVTVEPQAAKAEFLSGGGCFLHPAFAVRIWLRLHGEFFIRGLRFHFIDQFGTRSLPDVTPIPSPSSRPSSIPSSSPVPVPGIAALPTPFPAGGSAPFVVKFGCGVIPHGTLFINADHAGGTVAMKVRITEGE